MIKISGIDEQDNIRHLKLEYDKDVMSEYEKWIYGCFECVKCKHRTYQDVPYSLRRWGEENNLSIEVIKNKAKERLKEVYSIVDGMTDLHHRVGMCGGDVIYKDVDHIR